jgi:ATP phosphoribosyltransferase
MSLTIAIPTGRLKKECLDLLGVGNELKNKNSRKLVYLVNGYKLIEVKPIDVPIYVENGVADCGFVGKDILLENDYEVYELYDCKIGKCHLALAQTNLQEIKSIATKYVNIAKDYCLGNNLQVNIIKLNGSVELAPLLGLSNTILDIVSTGNTLKANSLIETEKIRDISVRLIANKASYQIKRDKITALMEDMQNKENKNA